MNLDSHKLMYHPHKVSKWLNGEIVYPIYSEISLTSACNHRCLFCAPNFFLNYKPEYIDTKILKDTLSDMATVGVKSIMYGGEGEPLLHKDIVPIIEYTKKLGMDVALTTNGVLFDSTMSSRLIPYLSWIKFSIDAGKADTYAKLHGTKWRDFDIALTNMSRASFFKRLKKHNCKIGVQSILFKENIDELHHLAKYLKYAKPDYFVVKPYSEHTGQLHKDLHHPEVNQINNFCIKMKEFEYDYNFIFRGTAFDNVNEEKPYDKCYAQDFMAYIDTLGGVHSCINFIGDASYNYGSIYENSFQEIWKNKQSIEPDLNKCRTICRMDNINRYLWELKNPNDYVNFI